MVHFNSLALLWSFSSSYVPPAIFLFIHRQQATNVEGVMSAEGNLHNPGIFKDGQFKNYELAQEYLDIVKKYPASKSCVRGHLFKMFHHSLVIHQDLRTVLAVCDSHVILLLAVV